MGVYEGRGALSKAIKELMLRWNETKLHWDDAVSERFEEAHLAPLEMDLRNATSAMDHMAVLLSQIRRDCE
ncbi:MAG TPA: hypothetical protein VIL86_02495 [Tepidisphaeraceae bacterium]|jgi:hypothetical protein